MERDIFSRNKANEILFKVANKKYLLSNAAIKIHYIRRRFTYFQGQRLEIVISMYNMQNNIG